ncbi:unnamed protein product [Merluccius merluccius]
MSLSRSSRQHTTTGTHHSRHHTQVSAQREERPGAPSVAMLRRYPALRLWLPLVYTWLPLRPVGIPSVLPWSAPLLVPPWSAPLLVPPWSAPLSWSRPGLRPSWSSLACSLLGPAASYCFAGPGIFK